MKKLLHVLIAMFFCLPIVAHAQDDFNEPPTRSEFEQLKSKIQVYERKQNQVLYKMDNINAEVDTAIVKLDSTMNAKMTQMDSMVQAIRLESQGIKSDVASQFLTAEDLNPLEEAVEKNKSMKQQIDDMQMFLFGLAGLVFILLVLVIIQWVTRGGRMRKLKKEMIEKIENDLLALKTDIENNITNKESTTNQRIDAAKKDLLDKINENKTASDVTHKELGDKIDKHVVKIKKQVEDAHEAAVKREDEKVNAVEKRQEEALETHRKKAMKDIDEMKDKLLAAEKAIEKLKPKK
jgi:hypothetical protein